GGWDEGKEGLDVRVAWAPIAADAHPNCEERIKIAVDMRQLGILRARYGVTNAQVMGTSLNALGSVAPILSLSFTIKLDDTIPVKTLDLVHHLARPPFPPP